MYRRKDFTQNANNKTVACCPASHKTESENVKRKPPANANCVRARKRKRRVPTQAFYSSRKKILFKFNDVQSDQALVSDNAKKNSTTTSNNGVAHANAVQTVRDVLLVARVLYQMGDA